jgi:hypothetical protein
MLRSQPLKTIAPAASLCCFRDIQGDASSFHWLVVRQPHVDYGARATTGDAGDWDIKQSFA